MLLELERKEKLVLEVGGKRRSRKRTATRKRLEDNEDEEESEEEAQGWNHHQDRLTSGQQSPES